MVVSQLTGIIPTVVMSGAFLKITKASLGGQKRRVSRQKRSRRSPGRIYSPLW